MFEVYCIKTYTNDSYYVTEKQCQAIRQILNKKDNSAVRIGDTTLRVSSIAVIGKIRIQKTDLPKYCLEQIVREGIKEIEASEETGEIRGGVVLDYYDEMGNKIKKPKQTDKQVPQKFVRICKVEYFKYVMGENGKQELVKTSEAITERTYYRSVRCDGYYDFLVVLVTKENDEIVLDRRPKGWTFGNE